MSDMVPRDGIGSACSLVFTNVHFVLKERLYCPLLFIVYCCQSSAMLSGLLSRKLTIHLADNEVRRGRRGETNEQVFHMLSLCFVGFLFFVPVSHVFLCVLVVFRRCYISCYILFYGRACCLVATWFC